MEASLQCTVTHQGVPIGLVTLDVDERRGLGTLQPSPAYDAVRPLIQDVARLGPMARVELLVLPPDAPVSSPAIGKAALEFDLVDMLGSSIPTEAVRLVELHSRPGVTVLAQFRRAPAAVPARTRVPPASPGGESSRGV
jgi:hypothetical protein